MQSLGCQGSIIFGHLDRNQRDVISDDSMRKPSECRVEFAIMLAIVSTNIVLCSELQNGSFNEIKGGQFDAVIQKPISLPILGLFLFV